MFLYPLFPTLFQLFILTHQTCPRFQRSLLHGITEFHSSSSKREKKKVSLHFEANADPPLTPPPPRGGGWNVSIGKNRWVPCYLLLRFLGQGRDRWGATVDRGIGGLPSLHPGEISYLRRTVCAEERAAYTYLHPPRRGPDTTL